MRANIYIRKENEELWEAVMDKSAFVNNRLTEGLSMDDLSKDDISKTVADKSEKKITFCKHGFAFGLCKFGCK